MAQFPTAIYTARETENLPGIVYDPNNKQNMYSEDFQNLANEIKAIQEAFLTDDILKALQYIYLNGNIKVFNKYLKIYNDSTDSKFLFGCRDADNVVKGAFFAVWGDDSTSDGTTHRGTAEFVISSQVNTNPTFTIYLYNGSTWESLFQIKGDGSILRKGVEMQRYRSGVVTRDLSTASGTQTITHGLDKIPRKVSIKGVYNNTTIHSRSDGQFDEVGNNCIYSLDTDGSSMTDLGNSTTYAIKLGTSSTAHQVGVITVSSTQITITWTKTGSPTGTAQILWGVE